MEKKKIEFISYSTKGKKKDPLRKKKEKKRNTIGSKSSLSFSRLFHADHWSNPHKILVGTEVYSPRTFSQHYGIEPVAGKSLSQFYRDKKIIKIVFNSF